MEGGEDGFQAEQAAKTKVQRRAREWLLQEQKAEMRRRAGLECRYGACLV